MNQSRTEYSKPRLPSMNPSSQLQVAIAEDSNHLLDWTWYADQMTSVAERRYCLERARYIAPGDRQVLKALAALNQQETWRRITTSKLPAGWLARLLANINL